MVLFKRKPVRFSSPSGVKDDNTEVWHIPQTGEIFGHYDDFLAKMDFYKQRRFNCQISGRSGLTFFEALKSELAGAEEVEQAFPEALKKPVLARVQFQTVSRIDTLVDKLFDDFKSDYYPGESVTVRMANGERLQGVVREKTRFGSRVLPDGTLVPATTKYFVTIADRDDTEAVVDDTHIFRDRKAFTKAMIRGFIKQTVTREAWNGAPWLVKHDYAAQYSIDTRIPPQLRYDTKLMERKLQQAQKRASMTNEHDHSALNGQDYNGPARLPDLKPVKSHKSNKPLAHGQQPPHFSHGPKSRNILGGPEPGIFPAPHTGNPFQLPNFRNNEPTPHRTVTPPPPPPPPPPKYPIDDLLLEPKPGKVRPALRFMCRDPPESKPAAAEAVNGEVETEVKVEEAKTNGETVGHASDLIANISMASVGPLLETWDTLNVYCEIFKLDSFTFDDFVEALHVASADTPVQLVDEIHCSVLKILVSAEADGGKLNVPLPELEEESDEEEEGEEEEEARSPTPEADKPPARATRSSLAKAEAERLLAEARAAELEAAQRDIKHRAEQLLEDYDWIEHLRKRDFKDGGWEMILVGLLHQLSKDERKQQSCEDLLAQLVPPEIEEPTQETVKQRYASLSLDYRVQALQILCMLTTRTKAIRAYMEDCSETMTGYRKEKIEWQRQRKQAVEELRQLNDQRKLLLPDNTPPSPTNDTSKLEDDAKETDVDSTADVNGAGSETEDDGQGRKKGRRLNDRSAERQRKRKAEQERKSKAAAEAAKMPKQSKQFIKVLKDIQKKEEHIKQCEDEIAVLDNDLREADCPRTRVLGKDRFWNRYYWFERNGMPYGGLPDSSTAAADYANGCIWVQGPDELEREGYIDMKPEWQDEYRARFDVTVPERKRREEGATSVHHARQWGYYSEPEELDALLAWLDPRGVNELKLRKEIVAFRDKMVKNMESRRVYLDKKDDKEEKPAVAPARGVAKRAAARMQTPPETVRHRCQAWANTTALEELGHLHSEPAPAPRSRKQTKKRQAAEPSPEPAPAAKTRRRK
ncbi:hypothetical protein B0T11DRAFT_125249 [Plectosphaerella cucumerina]|uniref:Uncharacterized protein n=1 Tax=Plectosphaerella cucumerina TaxID=40658 RepID=A0A8K0TEX8_9PEZI|nr:hypothetical protein B0T11DRAFT_125249 [Plectosphaerella cucumerina]